MLYILIGLLLGMCLSIVLIWYGNQDYETINLIATMSGVILSLVFGLMLIVYCIAGFQWIGAEYQKDIINREYGTNYTREEVFFASDVIDIIRELDRNRIEVNGNIMRGGEVHK